MHASLVPAYVVCATPNRTHGPPLAFPSCNPPTERSAVLTVGTPDANGAPADMAGFVRMQVIAGDPATPGDEADVAMEASVTDVRCSATSAACPGGPGSDYAGQVACDAQRAARDRSPQDAAWTRWCPWHRRRPAPGPVRLHPDVESRERFGMQPVDDYRRTASRRGSRRQTLHLGARPDPRARRRSERHRLRVTGLPADLRRRRRDAVPASGSVRSLRPAPPAPGSAAAAPPCPSSGTPG